MNKRQKFFRYMLKEFLITYAAYYQKNSKVDKVVLNTMIEEFLDSDFANINQFIEVMDGPEFRYEEEEEVIVPSIAAEANADSNS